jgi:hypothetical protein
LHAVRTSPKLKIASVDGAPAFTITDDKWTEIEFA